MVAIKTHSTNPYPRKSRKTMKKPRNNSALATITERRPFGYGDTLLKKSGAHKKPPAKETGGFLWPSVCFSRSLVDYLASSRRYQGV